MKRGPLAVLLRLLVLTPFVFGALALAPAPAQAATGSEVTVTIDGMTPALPTADGTVRLSGSVQNVSSGELSNLQVAFWGAGEDPITSRVGLSDALESAATDPIGDRTNGGQLFQNIPSETDRTLGPGETTRFDLTAEVADLELGADAVYLIGVHVRGRTDPVGPDETLGRGRIFLPFVRTEPSNALRQTSLVTITSRPSWVRAGLLSDDHLAEEVQPDGRLSGLLEAAGRADASFAIDPALVQEITTMSQGYQVLTPSGAPEAGTGQAAATAWLRELTSAIADGDGFRLPYGNPDVTALVHTDRTDLLQQAVELGEEVAPVDDLPLLVVPADGLADAAVVNAVERLGPSGIVLSDVATRSAGPLLRAADGGTAPIVTYSAGTLQGGPGPAPRRTAVKVRQRMLADTWLEARGAAANRTVGRVRLITTAAQATAAAPEDAVPWLKPSTLSNLLKGTPSSWSQDYRYTATDRRKELSSDQFALADRLSQDYATYEDLLVNPGPVQTEARGVLARALSSAWRGANDEQVSYLTPIRDRIRSVLESGVEMSANPRVLTTGGNATFPVTVKNTLAPNLDADGKDLNAVSVEIRFDSSNSQRINVATKQVPGGIIGNASATENVDVRIRANGTVRVVAQLVTRSGRPVGRPLPIEVNATQAGTTGWFIAIAAGVVLLGSTALRIRQVTKERAAGADSAAVVVSRPPEDADSGHDRETLDV